MPTPQRSFTGFPRYPSYSQRICFACQNKLQKPSYRASSSSSAPNRRSETPELYHKNKSYSKVEYLVLPRLNHGIGVDWLPREGDQPAIDPRTWAERRDAWWEIEANNERRRRINRELNRGYYRDLARMGWNRGKTYVAPELPLKASVAKYFPNFQGYTLADSWNWLDTTTVLKGKISVVGFQSLAWAGKQVRSFVGKKENPELAGLLEELKHSGLQKVIINFEDNYLRMFLIYLFLWFARWKNDKTDGFDMRARSMIVTKGVDRDFFEDHLGVTNLRAGYVYLVDSSLKIRWAGNGDADDEERKSIVNVARKLVQERNAALEMKKVVSAKRRPVKEKKRELKPLAALMV